MNLILLLFLPLTLNISTRFVTYLISCFTDIARLLVKHVNVILPKGRKQIKKKTHKNLTTKTNSFSHKNRFCKENRRERVFIFIKKREKRDVVIIAIIALKSVHCVLKTRRACTSA